MSNRAFETALKEYRREVRVDNRDLAIKRYRRWRSEDPYPDLDATLLGSADICAYAATTGMIFPFRLKPERFHPASYALTLKGECRIWDASSLRAKRSFTIKEDQEFVLPRDSIAFLTLDAELRLPDYLAMRFNLRIEHVYKGLLLGTGPMVDPGFQGRLSIPLYNFTTNEYLLRGGERLIWAEFTKLAPAPGPDGAGDEGDTTGPTGGGANAGDYKHGEADSRFDPAPRDPDLVYRYKAKSGRTAEPQSDWRDVDDYLHEAAPGHPVFSSTSEALDKADQARKRILQASVVGVILVVLGLVPLASVAWKYHEEVKDYKADVQKLRARFDALERRVPDPRTNPGDMPADESGPSRPPAESPSEARGR